MCLKMREKLISINREWVERKGNARGDGEAMGDEGWSCEKDLNLAGREFQR